VVALLDSPRLHRAQRLPRLRREIARPRTRSAAGRRNFNLLPVEIKVPKIKWANDTNEIQEDEFVSDSIIRDTGDFVPLNNDDDNYSGTPDMDDMGEGTELIAIEGPNGELAETDLLPFIDLLAEASEGVPRPLNLLAQAA